MEHYGHGERIVKDTWHKMIHQIVHNQLKYLVLGVVTVIEAITTSSLLKVENYMHGDIILKEN